MAGYHADVIANVERALAQHDVVVVGMATNPHVKRARRALSDANIRFEYLEFGGYLSRWKERLAIKMWSGWPTFPQVFVRGKLVGGADQTATALEDGSLKRALEGKAS
ncbi:MAG: glutaredoxin [Polyangiaceae bacterium]|nr:glutaredoxin [Polyangiaceae bacterium]